MQYRIAKVVWNMRYGHVFSIKLSSVAQLFSTFRPHKHCLGVFSPGDMCMECENYEWVVANFVIFEVTETGTDGEEVETKVAGTGWDGWAVGSGSFRGERVGTPFPLLKCLRTHYGRHFEPFSGQKCTRLQDFAYTTSSFFPGIEAPRCLDQDTNFRLVRQRSHCSCFTQRTTAWIVYADDIYS